MSTNKCSVLSFSGGMDSTSLLLNLLSKNHDIYAISFKYGQKHEVEVELAKRISNTFQIVGLKIRLLIKYLISQIFYQILIHL